MKKQIFLSAIMLLGGIFTFNGLRAQNVGIGTEGGWFFRQIVNIV